MRFSFSLTLLLASTALAHPSPKKANKNAQANANANATAQCDPKNVAKLVGGIQANLNIQAQELKGVLALQKLVNANANAANGTAPPPPAAAAAAPPAYGAPADPAAAAAPPKDPNAAQQQQQQGQQNQQFAQEQAAVLSIQQAGVDFRKQNQELAKKLNSPAQDGLAIVAKAQLQEISQVQALTGDPAKDDAVLKMLVQEVQDGTKQNEKNLKAAESQCA